MAHHVSGFVNHNLEAIITLQLTNGAQIDCLLDTGFDGAVMLPRAFVRQYKFPLEGGELFHVVGHKKPVMAQKVTVSLAWLGQEFDVSGIINEEGLALIGTELLIDCRLTIDYVSGSVVIEQINF